MANACGALNGSVMSQPIIYHQRPGPQAVGCLKLHPRSSLVAPHNAAVGRGWRDGWGENVAQNDRSLHQRKISAQQSGTCRGCRTISASLAARKSETLLTESEDNAERLWQSLSSSASVSYGFGVGTMPWLTSRPRLCRQQTRRRSRSRQPFVARAAGSGGMTAAAAERPQSTKTTQQEAGGGGGLVSGEDLDFTARVLSETPSQVEPRFLVDGKILTLRERRLQGNSFLGRQHRVVEDEVDQRSQESSVDTGVEGSHEAPDSQPVFLKDLLREYKGNLYVPEEAFKERLPEVESFSRTLVALPQMTAEDFWHYVKVGQVECLTSRGIAGPRAQFQYRDFIVDLKDCPGDSSLQQRRWALRANLDEAAVILQEYKGKQREVETYHTPYVEVPSKAPHPVAATVSARITTEVTIFASLVVSAAFAVASLTSSSASALFQALSFVFMRVVRPVVLPLVQPVLWLVVRLALLIWAPIGAALGAVGSLVGVDSAADLITSLPTFFVDTAGGMATSSTGSSFATGGLIVFVLAFMVAMAKFTLTRRPKDFRKWDIWQAIDFGQSKPQARVDPNSVGVKFEDVAGIDEVVTELQELVTYLKDPDRFSRMGTKPPHGVLLEGPPGCGKTLLAKAIAGEAGVPFYQMAGSEFVEILVGVGAARVRDLFKRAKVNRPAVVFIDEIDALGTARDRLMPSDKPGQQSNNTSAQERETTLNQLLIELDGFDTGKGVIFLGATNRSDMLDAALLRPGRFDRKVSIRPPLAQGRLEILQVHAKKLQLDESVDLWTLAKNLPGFTGAMLAQLMQEAGLMSFRRGDTLVKREDVDRALDRLTMGTEREVTAEKTEMHRRMALHELGMGLCSQILYRSGAGIEPLDRVSVAPRGNTLSRTMFDRMDDEEYVFERRPALISRLMVMLAGRAAEELVYGSDTSTYSLTHLPDATWLARKIVSVWNLGEKMVIKGDKVPWDATQSFAGPVMAFEGILYEDYAFRDFTHSTEAVDDISEQSRRLLDATYARTFQLLKEHRDVLQTLLEALLERDELLNSDIDEILDRAALPPPPSVRGALASPPSDTLLSPSTNPETDESTPLSPPEAGPSQRPEPPNDTLLDDPVLDAISTQSESLTAEGERSQLSLSEEAAVLAEINTMSAEEEHAALGLGSATSANDEDATSANDEDGTSGSDSLDGGAGTRARDSLPTNDGGDPGQSGLQASEESMAAVGSHDGRVGGEAGDSGCVDDGLSGAEVREQGGLQDVATGGETGGSREMKEIVIGGDGERAEDGRTMGVQSWGAGGDVSGMLGSRNPGPYGKRQNGKPGVELKATEPTPVRSGALE